jgi:hypothetical protein
MECATLTFAQCIQNHQRVASSRTLNSHARDAKVLRERESEKTLQVLLTTRKIPLVLIGAKPPLSSAEPQLRHETLPNHTANPTRQVRTMAPPHHGKTVAAFVRTILEPLIPQGLAQ